MYCIFSGGWVSYLWPCTNDLTNSFIVSRTLFPFFIFSLPFWALMLEDDEIRCAGKNFHTDRSPVIYIRTTEMEMKLD